MSDYDEATLHICMLIMLKGRRRLDRNPRLSGASDGACNR